MPRCCARLSTLDRFLPVWIIAAMALGIGLGRAFPGLNRDLDTRQGRLGQPADRRRAAADDVPGAGEGPLRPRLGRVTGDRRLLVASLVLNWIVGPALMFTLAWLLLPDLPTYRTGLIIVGLARCIAMVLIWNDLSCGDREAAAVLVAINSVFQIVAFAGPRLLLPAGAARAGSACPTSSRTSRSGPSRCPCWCSSASRSPPASSPGASGEAEGAATGMRARFLPKIGPVALYGLLFTIVVLFALQGHTITSRPGDVARIALPLLAYFAIMFAGAFALGRRLRPRLRQDRHPGLHRRRQQLRAGHRRRYRGLRRDLRPGPGWRRRAAHRGARPGRAGVRRPVGPPALLPRRPFRSVTRVSGQRVGPAGDAWFVFTDPVLSGHPRGVPR